MIPFRKTAALAFALLTAGMLFGCGASSEPESSAAESQQSSEAPAESSEPADAPESDAASQPDEETDAVIGFETVTAKPGDKKVPLTVVIRNNPGRCQMAQTGFPCLLHGAVASQHGNGFEMADPCKVRPFAEQKFTAPHGSVRTGTGTVEAHRQGLPCQVMLCHHR